MKQMKKAQNILVASLLCIGAVGVQAANTHITAITCGNWNSAGIHASGTSYRIGVNPQHPNMQAAYFEFNLAAVKGVKVTSCGILIPGSTDYNITSYWSNPDNGNPSHIQFKVGTTSQGASSLSSILTGNNSTTVYNNAGKNSDLGYDWVGDGLHSGLVFDAWHYESTGAHAPDVQNAVNAGGNYIFWTLDRYNKLQSGAQCT